MALIKSTSSNRISSNKHNNSSCASCCVEPSYSSLFLPSKRCSTAAFTGFFGSEVGDQSLASKLATVRVRGISDPCEVG